MGRGLSEPSYILYLLVILIMVGVIVYLIIKYWEIFVLLGIIIVLVLFVKIVEWIKEL